MLVIFTNSYANPGAKTSSKKVSILGVNLNHQIGEIKYILSAQRTFFL